MASDEDAAKLRLTLHYVGREIELRRQLLTLERDLRATEDAERVRVLSERLIECRANISDNDIQLQWLRGGAGQHTAH